MKAKGRPRGSKDGAGTSRPTPFRIRFVAAGEWQIQQGTQWRRAREISILASTITLASGVLVGEGIVTRTGPDTFAVTA